MSPLKPFGREDGGHPKYRERARPHGDTTGLCCICGLKAGKGGHTVFLTSIGEYTTEAEAKALWESGADCLGHYPVGSDCAKALRAAGIHVYKHTHR